MQDRIIVSIITFRYTRENIELLLISDGESTTHPRSTISLENDIERDMLREYEMQFGIQLLVISLAPLYQEDIVISLKKQNVKTKIFYYVGITDAHQEVKLANSDYEYLWIDHLGGRNAISSLSDITAYELARTWLYEDDEVALFTANNLQKLM